MDNVDKRVIVYTCMRQREHKGGGTGARRQSASDRKRSRVAA